MSKHTHNKEEKEETNNDTFSIKFPSLPHLKKNWQISLFIIILLMFTIIIVNVLSGLNSLPGPMYGGDVYYHLGHINHIYNGGSIFKNSSYLEGFEYYPWLTHFFVALFAWIAGLSAFKATIYFQAVSFFLSGVVAYFLVQKTFKNKYIAVLGGLFWACMGLPASTPSSFAGRVMIPFSFLMLFFFRSTKQKIVAAIVLGLCGVQHVVTFLGGNIFLLIKYIYSFILSIYVKIKESKHNEENKDNISSTRSILKSSILSILGYCKEYGFILMIAVPVAMLYWWAPFFIYHGKTLNPWQEYTGAGLLGVNFSFILSMFKTVFFNFDSILSIIFSLLAIIGLYFCIRNIKNNKMALSIIIFITGFIGGIHPLITKPLLGMSFGYYRFPIILDVSKFLFIITFVYVLYKAMKNKYYQYLILGIFLILIIFQFSATINYFHSNQWTQMGFEESEYSSALFNMADYVNENIDVNTVFISQHGETAFSMNALTGTKQVFFRRTHASAFQDYNQRAADAAVILYGNNSKTQEDLIKKYNLEYFYDDLYSAQQQQSCLGYWDMFNTSEGYADYSYSCIRTSTNYKEYLEENGLTVQIVNARMDVSDNNAPTFDLVIIKPGQLTLITETVHHEIAEGQVVALLGKIV